MQVGADAIGSSLLSAVDRLALEAFPKRGNVSAGNICEYYIQALRLYGNNKDVIAGEGLYILAMQAQVIPADVTDYITTINSQYLFDGVPLMSIQVPSELIQQFTNSSDGEGEGVRAIAALYYNVEDLFPNGTNKYESRIVTLGGRGRGISVNILQNNISCGSWWQLSTSQYTCLTLLCSAQLGSGIVSTGLQCGDSFCSTSEIKLTNPVLITIQRSNAVTVI